MTIEGASSAVALGLPKVPTYSFASPFHTPIPMLTGLRNWAEIVTKLHIKKIGCFAALTAAYALVFNMVLTSALLATISPLNFNALQQLCLNSGFATSNPGGDEDSNKPIPHCPLCVINSSTADLPPQTPTVAIRIAFRILFEPVLHDHFVVRFANSAHHPRGPPHIS